ncbi:MAG TPA: 50S ribosomal protein L17 [Candidatus Saccharimonadia bacterium]|jgi:large subunit ribosomal protein L17
MHRHGYQGRKLQLAAGPRRALIRGQLTSLVLHEAISTTEAKAKEVAPKFERLVTYAKKGTLAGGRSLRRELLTENAVQKMLQELKPAFEGRQGGYTRIIKLENRRGDNASMARVELVLNEVTKLEAKPAKATKAKAPKAEVATKTEAPKAQAPERETVEAAK